MDFVRQAQSSLSLIVSPHVSRKYSDTFDAKEQ